MQKKKFRKKKKKNFAFENIPRSHSQIHALNLSLGYVTNLVWNIFLGEYEEIHGLEIMKHREKEREKERERVREREDEGRRKGEKELERKKY